MQAHEQLERDWSEFNGLDPAGMVACSSGTAALHLALEAMQLPSGSEVLVPDYTMIACARAVTLAGLTPVFVDCGDDLLMDTSLFAQAMVLNDTWVNASAVLWVAVYGRVNMNDRQYLADECKRHEMRLIEDLAEAHGVRPHSQTDAACWSFQRSKIIAGEEGGAVWFRDFNHAALARRLRSLGFDHQPSGFHDYRHVPRGHNYRLANLLAEPILCSIADSNRPLVISEGMSRRQTSKTPLEWRRAIEAAYDAACPPEWRQPPRDVVWVYDVRVSGMSVERQEAAVRQLNVEGIAARTGFRQCSTQEEFRDCRTVGSGGAETAAREVICLLVVPGRTDAERTMSRLKELLA